MKFFDRTALHFNFLAPVMILAVLFWLVFSSLPGDVEAADGSGRGQPAFQETDYPVEEEDTSDSGDDYPGIDPGSEDPNYPGAATETLEVVDQPTETEMATDQPTPNLPRTVTPSPTGLPSSTPEGTAVTPTAATLTLTFTPTVLSTPAEAGKEDGKGEDQGGGIDWGLFWIGFSLPVLAAGGAVLYLLDRQPSLFQKQRKQLH